MGGNYIIACDLGSQGIKTSIYDIEGNILSTYNTNTKIYTIGPGALVYHGDDFYRLTVQCIKAAFKHSKLAVKDISVLSFTGMGSGVMGVDKNWKPISEYTDLIDNRDHFYLNNILKNYSDLIRLISGTGIPHGVNKIIWFQKEYPEIYKETKKFLTVTHYVIGKLAGLNIRDAFCDFSSITFSGMANANKNIWSEEICHIFNIDIDKLPRIVNPTEIIGTLVKKPAEDCGLITGIPIVAGAYDKACDFLAAGANEIGSIVDNAATYPGFLASVDKFIPDMKYKTLEFNQSVIPGIWMTQTFMIGGGLTHKWFVDTFYNEYKYKYKKTGLSSYELLDNEASKISPGSDTLLFIPHLAGQATPNNLKIKGLWIGFTWTHSRLHFYRSILESFAYENAHSLMIHKSIYPHIKFNQVKVLGGGSKSHLWNQIKADVLGIPYVRLNRNDLTTLGAAIIGGKSIGLFKDMHNTSRKFVKELEIISPRPDFHNYYHSYTKAYLRLYQNVKRAYSDLSKIEKAPKPY